MTRNTQSRRIALLLSTALLPLSMASVAQAAEAAAAADVQVEATGAAADQGDIVVTARKRNETLISVPVVVSAVGAAELQRRGITNLDGISRIVPQLIIGPQGGSVQGGNIALRGVTGPNSNPFGDQAVSFNIDGVQVAKATVRRMADTDLEQIEVLKGPQALFFGKNSPAGIVSIHTADPTPDFKAGLSAGYEFKAHEFRTNGFISGPISETLGFRVAGIYSRMRGDFTDTTPRNSVYAPIHRHGDWRRDFAVRGTLKWEPSPDFDARLKINYGQTRNAGPQSTGQFINCGNGVSRSTVGIAQFLGSTANYSSAVNQCTPGGRVTNSGYGPVIANIPATLGSFRKDGGNFQNQKQFLGGLEMNYHLTDQLTVTSVTGYYKVRLRQCQNYETDFAILLPSCNPYDNKEFSQELRLSTDYEAPLNFTGGVYYSKTNSSTGSVTYIYGNDFDLIAPGLGGPNSPLPVNNYFLKQKGTAYSAYLQMIFKPIDVIEINVGGRYSHEKKKLPLVQDGLVTGTGTLLTSASTLTIAKNKDSWNDFSPEITVSYRPTDKLTVFGSYKHGFLSGGFNSSSVDFSQGIDLAYDPQTIKGFEIGLKALVLDNRLRFNLAAYTYDVSDLQVTNFINANGFIRNAGAVKVKGIETDVSYRTPLEGLTVNAAAAYNKANYTSFPNAPCYNGQTPALGCTIVNGTPRQDLAGTQVPNAPRWNLSASFDYETPVTDDLRFGLSASANYTSSQLTDASSAPQSRQPKYTLVDATARVLNDTWELALIGRNLTDKRYFISSPNVPFTGGGTGTAAGVLGDRFASVSRGRELMVRATYKFNP